MNSPAKPLSVQLYSLRQEAAKDFPAVLRRLAKIGYKGVEPAGLFGFTPKDFRTFVEDLGMVISSTHSPWVNEQNVDQAIEDCGVMGVKLAAGGYGRAEFASLEAIQKTAEITNGLNEKLARTGLTLVIHNHAWEFEKLGDRLKHEIFAELCPDVQFELDTFWAANFGANDPAEMMPRFGHRAPLLHIKDGLFTPPPEGQRATLLPAGSGDNDIPGIIGALDPAVTQWLVVEQDHSDTDMFTCIESSYRYLTSNGLAVGNV